MPDPKKQKKRVWKVDFHESDPSRRKISLHNAKKYAIAGLREKKHPPRPALDEKQEVTVEEGCTDSDRGIQKIVGNQMLNYAGA